MDENVISVSTQKYDRLIQIEAKVQALMAFVNHTEYSVDRKLIGSMLGFSVGGVKDGTD